jgi:hypothetical protein
MVEVQRIWRVNTAANGAIDVRLSSDKEGDHLLLLSDEGKERALDLDEARAVAQAILEACEVDSALDDDLAPAGFGGNA